MGVSKDWSCCCGGGLLGTIGVNGYEEFVTAGLGIGGSCKIGTEGINCMFWYTGGAIWVGWLAKAASIKFLCFFRHFFRPLLVWGIGGKIDDTLGWGAKAKIKFIF